VFAISNVWSARSGSWQTYRLGSETVADARQEVRVFLKNFAKRRILLLTRSLRKPYRFLPPLRSQQLTEALERLSMRRHTAPDIAALGHSNPWGGLLLSCRLRPGDDLAGLRQSCQILDGHDAGCHALNATQSLVGPPPDKERRTVPRRCRCWDRPHHVGAPGLPLVVGSNGEVKSVRFSQAPGK